MKLKKNDIVMVCDGIYQGMLFIIIYEKLGMCYSYWIDESGIEHYDDLADDELYYIGVL